VKRTLVMLAVGLIALACDGRPRRTGGVARHAANKSLKSGVVAEVDLSGGIPESTNTSNWLPLPASRTYVGLVRALVRLRTDRDSRAVLVRLGATRLDWAKAEELGPLLEAIRKDKPVVCHAHSISDSALWFLARGCDRIWLSAAGDVDTVGISAQIVYLRGLLDRLGVRADFISMGRYKSAAESLLRQGPSDEARQELLGTLGSIRKVWLDDLRKARPAAADAAESGPWGAQEALSRHVIDAVGDSSAARDDAQARGHVIGSKVAFGPGAESSSEIAVAEIVRTLSGIESAASDRPHIAVLPAIGGITMGSDQLFSSSGIGYASMVKTIDELSEDPLVRAVVLRIDSPGGSALASDLLWLRLTELAAKKPLIASVGSMAASGGYYLASASDSIVAARTSIVGSIGVVGGKLVIGEALDAYGVKTVTLSPNPDPGAAARAAYESPLVAWDDATRARITQQMHEVYELFVARVSRGRHLARDRVLASAEGRIFSGLEGKQRGLVDQLGGLDAALELARRRAGLGAHAPISVEGPAGGILAALGLDESASTEQLTAALTREHDNIWNPLRRAPREFVPTLVGLSPMLFGERVLAVLPILLRLR